MHIVPKNRKHVTLHCSQKFPKFLLTLEGKKKINIYKYGTEWYKYCSRAQQRQLEILQLTSFFSEYKNHNFWPTTANKPILMISRPVCNIWSEKWDSDDVGTFCCIRTCWHTFCYLPANYKGEYLSVHDQMLKYSLALQRVQSTSPTEWQNKGFRVVLTWAPLGCSGRLEIVQAQKNCVAKVKQFCEEERARISSYRTRGRVHLDRSTVRHRATQGHTRLEFTPSTH